MNLEDVLENSLKIFDADKFEKEMKAPNTIILDTREPDDVINGFIPGSLALNCDISIFETFAA